MHFLFYNMVFIGNLNKKCSILLFSPFHLHPLKAIVANA